MDMYVIPTLITFKRYTILRSDDLHFILTQGVTKQMITSDVWKQMVSRYFQCITLSLSMCKEYSNVVICKTPVFLQKSTEHFDTWKAFLCHHTQELKTYKNIQFYSQPCMWLVLYLILWFTCGSGCSQHNRRWGKVSHCSHPIRHPSETGVLGRRSISADIHGTTVPEDDPQQWQHRQWDVHYRQRHWYHLFTASVSSSSQ